MTNVQSYKEMEIRAGLMKTHPEWLKTIADLKNFQFEDKKDYSVTYRELSQRKNRTMYFDAVLFDEDTFIFTFTRYMRDFDGKMTNELLDRLSIKDIEVISFRVNDSYVWIP